MVLVWVGWHSKQTYSGRSWKHHWSHENDWIIVCHWLPVPILARSIWGWQNLLSSSASKQGESATTDHSWSLNIAFLFIEHSNSECLFASVIAPCRGHLVSDTGLLVWMATWCLFHTLTLVVLVFIELWVCVNCTQSKQHKCRFWHRYDTRRHSWCTLCSLVLSSCSLQYKASSQEQ